MSSSKESRVIFKTEWISILNTMLSNNREFGYVDIVDDKFRFFDSDPMFNGIKGMYVSVDQVLTIIDEYPK